MKKLVIGVAAVLIIMHPTQSSAYCNNTEIISIEKTNEATIQSKKIIYRYRINKKTGKRQYRRWDKDNKKWIDKYWIDE
jgi:hypothetical protein